ncbi:DTW domain-containing protein 1-like isoform X3 [Varroa jacobsoni]|nr:DTW domain-containing protein 1-like isoform X3 [Varroa jacobsoni]
MWFCYECRSPLPSLAGRFPQVKLPFIVDIIKHGKELNGKSTGVQASILSKEVNLFVYPNIPKYEDPSKVLLIFPCKEQFDDVCRQRSVQLGTEEKCVLCEGRHIKFAFNRVILIDSTWCQTKKILLDDRIASLPYRAGLTGRKSVFWRPQRGQNLEYLATVEALHEICRRWLMIQSCLEAEKVDNILFFFRYFYDKITSRYRTLLKAN